MTGEYKIRLLIKSRELFADGMSFGTAGPYEKLSGNVFFAIDPEASQNTSIIDRFDNNPVFLLSEVFQKLRITGRTSGRSISGR